MPYRDRASLRTKFRSLIPWWIHERLPHVVWRQRFGPAIERALKGWSKWDIAALGTDRTMIPAPRRDPFGRVAEDVAAYLSYEQPEGVAPLFDRALREARGTGPHT